MLTYSQTLIYLNPLIFIKQIVALLIQCRVIFHQDGKSITAVKEHVFSKQPKVLKFSAFTEKKVMECALLSSVTYGCEAWIDGSIKAAQTMYMSMVKTLAGVRVSTTNNLVLAELGLPSLETRVKKAQKLFMKKMVQTRVGLTDDPFMHIWQLCEANNTKGYQYLCKVLNEDLSLPEEIERRKISIKASTSSKSLRST